VKWLIMALTLAAAGPAAAQGMYGQAPNPYVAPNPYAAPNPYSYGSGSNSQSQGVQGYTNHNGGYVQPYERTMPNSTQTDNYNARGNVNPFNGAIGTRPPRY